MRIFSNYIYQPQRPDEFEVRAEDWLPGIISQKHQNSSDLLQKLNYTGSNLKNSQVIPITLSSEPSGTSSAIVRNSEIEPKFYNNASDIIYTEEHVFDTQMLAQVNNYKYIFENTADEVFNTVKVGDGEKDAGKKIMGDVMSMAQTPSLFNPFLSVNVVGFTKNIPLYNKQNFSNNSNTMNVTRTELHMSEGEGATAQKETQQEQVTLGQTEKDFTDCSIKKLVELSNTIDPNTTWSKLGMARYKYADFMYCKDLGRIPNNHLITLRRFPVPIGDNIMHRYNYYTDKSKEELPPDIGRMVCWLGESNKIEEILKYQYSATWKELNSKIEEKQSQEDSKDRGLIGSLVNLSSKTYLSAVAKGTAGSGNVILGRMFGGNSTLGKFMSNEGTYEGNEALGNYDQNRVYEPHDTVQNTHIYEGKLKFAQSFTLVFEYEMRAYDNINPRAAFMDLLANIHACTYKRGRFWGGDHKIVGAPGNGAGWAKANAIIDENWDALGECFSGIMDGGFNFESVLGAISNVVSLAGAKVEEAVDAAKEAVGNGGKNLLNTFKEKGWGEALKGMLKNKLGRPAMYAFNSLLKGDPVGTWHVTIGNPRAPIMSMGNLIIENSTIEHYGPLGIDDFPTKLKVSIQLKHAKSRDLVEIQQMYTGGLTALAMPVVGLNTIENYFYGANGGKLQRTGGTNENTGNNKYNGEKKHARYADHNNNDMTLLFGTPITNAIITGFSNFTSSF
jgi:hypothetical protein